MGEGFVTRPKHLRKELPLLPEHTARKLAVDGIRRAKDLAAAIRDEGPFNVARVVDPLDPQEVLALVTALAAMLPADVDPVTALAWCELPANEWPDALVVSEAGRYEDGARDGTALLAHRELGRRLRVTVEQVQARRVRRLRRAS